MIKVGARKNYRAASLLRRISTGNDQARPRTARDSRRVVRSRAGNATTISARSTTTKDEMVEDFRQRIFALSRAHDMVRPDSSQQKKAAELGDLLVTLVEPYGNTHSETERVHISTPKVLVGEKAATTLALVVHELATNSIKYGALSNANGAVDVKCSANGGEVKIVWSESGGPPPSTPSGRSGFGTELVSRSLSDQLSGTISASWPPTGAVITLKMSEARLGA